MTCTLPGLITLAWCSTSSWKKWHLAAFKVTPAFNRRFNTTSRCWKCSAGERESTITYSRYNRHICYLPPSRIISISR